MGLYGGLTSGDIHRRKGLKKGQQILDHMGSTELAANLFRATQTEEKLRRENIKGKKKANRTHREVGAKIRKTIDDQRGLECRYCGCKHFRVIYNQATWGGRIMRQRKCRHCGRRMTTWEQSHGEPLLFDKLCFHCFALFTDYFSWLKYRRL